MQLIRCSIENYKCFSNVTTLQLDAGFTVIVGQNNVGKTALLEALSLSFQQHPHRSAVTVPIPGMPPPPTTRVAVEFRLQRDELRHFMSMQGTYYFPAPELNVELFDGLTLADEKPESLALFVDTLLDQKEFSITATFERGPNETWITPEQWMYPVRPFHQPDGNRAFVACNIHPDGTRHLCLTQGGVMNDIRNSLATALRERIFRFTAQRRNHGICSFGSDRELRPDGENLASVLAALQADLGRFRRLNNFLHEILPTVRAVSVEAFEFGSDRSNRILVWTQDPSLERQDLTFSLDECGSGVGQVLAILAVVLTSRFPRPILLDEPQSFLHPGAVRKLIDVLRSFPQHQLIIATHNAAIIEASRPRGVYLVQKPDVSAIVTSIDPRKLEDAQHCLSEIGASFADIFGAENILWVEGPTERRCIPLILRVLTDIESRGTIVEAVINTGDFDGSHALLTLQVYKRLSGGIALVPPSIGFIFDDEGRPIQEKRELERRGDGKVRFLPRRMYENYLLHPEAIAHLLNVSDGKRESDIAPEDVDAWLRKHLPDAQFNHRLSGGDRGNPHWVAADLVLRQLFRNFTDSRVAYHKTEHAQRITEWLLTNKPEHLHEIGAFLRDTFKELRSRGGL